MKKKFLIFVLPFVLLLSQTIYADTGRFFKIRVSGSILIIRTTIPNHRYPDAGIRINTPGYSVVNCKPSGNFCLFSVSDKKPAKLVIDGPKGSINVTLCLKGTGPLSCQNYNINLTSGTPRFAFIADNAVTDFHQCSINPNTGEFTNCPAIPFADFTGDIAFNSRGTFGYVSTFSNGVYVCNVNTNTGAFSNCVTTGNGLANVLLGIALHKFNTMTFAYISSAGANNVTKCDVNNSTGVLSNCAVTGPGFNQPTGITINRAGTYAYIGNGAGNGTELTKCAIDPVTGDLNDCESAYFGDFAGPTWVAFNPLETMAYVANNIGNTISVCSVDRTTGALFRCSNTGIFAYDGPYSIALNSSGTFAYITESSPGDVVKCTVNTKTGALTSCALTGPNLGGALGITLYS